jgi:hypothetical protein
MPSSTGVRLVLKFNFSQQIRSAGWSESYDLGFADLPTAINATPNLNAFMYDRCLCLGVGPLLIEAVLAAYVQPLHPGDPAVRRNTASLVVPDFPKAGLSYNKAFNVPTPPYTADFATTVYYMSMQTSLFGTPVYRRNCWIAGLPDIADQSDSPLITEGSTLAAVNKFIGDLNNTNATLGGKCNVSIRSIDRSAANPIKPCTAWNLTLNTYTVPAHGFVANQPIIAQGMKVEKGGIAPRGRYLVGVVIDANTITLQGAKIPSPPEKTGGFRAAIETFNPVTLVEQQGFTKRDKGKPSGLSVGRRRALATEPA